MTRDELEHIIRASGDITNQYEFMIVGSQSILGPVPDPAEVFTMSAEADIYPLHAPELAEKIEGAIGEWLTVSRNLWVLRARRGARDCDPAFRLDEPRAPRPKRCHERPRRLLPGCGRPLHVQGCSRS